MDKRTPNDGQRGLTNCKGKVMRGMREHKAKGPEALALATWLLQRARLADPDGGIWEAADAQWWWRRPRVSDDVEQPFWIDGDGPVAGVLMTSLRDDRWQCDPVILSSVEIDPALVWDRAQHLISDHARGALEIHLRDDDPTFTKMATDAGLVADESPWTIAWMVPQSRPATGPPAHGFRIVDRSVRSDSLHPMSLRNGPEIAGRLRECTLYDPELDLAVETSDGRPAGYSVYWFDPVTRVGHVEPMRVEDEFQRRGLATAMLVEGLDRLARRGADRLKIGFGTKAASAVYQGVGFRPAATVTVYEATLPLPTGE